MSDTTEAASQPAPQAQNSDGKGKNNVSEASLIAMLKQAKKSPETEQPAAETNAEAPDTAQAAAATPQDEQSEATATPEAEAGTQEGEAPTTEEADAEESSFKDSKLTPEQQAKIDKRIGKEVAKRKAEAEARKAAEDRIVALEKQLNEKPTAVEPVFQVTPDNPLGDVNDLSALNARHKEAKEIKRWAEEALDGDSTEFQVGGQTLGRADVKAILRNASRALEDHIPERATFLQKREAVQKQAEQIFPWIKDKTTPEYHQLQDAFRARPYLRNDPEATFLVACAMKGMQALQAEQAATQKKSSISVKAKPPASQASVSASSSTPRVNSDLAQKREADAAVQSIVSKKKNLGQGDLTAVLLARSKVNKTR